MALYLGKQKVAPIILKDNGVDLSATTATAEDVVAGKQFYNAEGELVVGVYKDMLQRKVDWSKSCKSLFEKYPDEDMTWVNKLDTSLATSTYQMFYQCKNATIIDISSYNIDNVTTAYRMFASCEKVKNIIGLNKLYGTNVADIYGMFEGCFEIENIDLSNFMPAEPTTIQKMFYSCKKVETINIQNVDTSEVKTFDSAFYLCSTLKTIIGTIDMINATTATNMLNYCYLLEDITLKNIKISLQLGSGTSYGTKLTNETLINTIQQLWDLTGSTSQTLTLSTTSKENIANVYVKLVDVTDEMLASDPYASNKKPCVVCESTDEGAMTLTEYAISKNWSIA